MLGKIHCNNFLMKSPNPTPLRVKCAGTRLKWLNTNSFSSKLSWNWLVLCYTKLISAQRDAAVTCRQMTRGTHPPLPSLKKTQLSLSHLSISCSSIRVDLKVTSNHCDPDVWLFVRKGQCEVELQRTRSRDPDWRESGALIVLNKWRQCGGVPGANDEPAWHVGTPTGRMTHREGRKRRSSTHCFQEARTRRAHRQTVLFIREEISSIMINKSMTVKWIWVFCRYFKLKRWIQLRRHATCHNNPVNCNQRRVPIFIISTSGLPLTCNLNKEVTKKKIEPLLRENEALVLYFSLLIS